MGVCYTKYELKDYDLSIIPEIDNPEAELKIMTAILWSLKEKKLLNQQTLKFTIKALTITACTVWGLLWFLL